jgi:hypothetical protein
MIKVGGVVFRKRNVPASATGVAVPETGKPPITETEPEKLSGKAPEVSVPAS